MSKAKRKPIRKTPALTLAEEAQHVQQTIVRRQHQRAKRLRAYARALGREMHRLEADVETFAMSILHDRGFVIVHKKAHDDIIDENIELRQQLTQAELLIVELRGAGAGAPV